MRASKVGPRRILTVPLSPVKTGTCTYDNILLSDRKHKSFFIEFTDRRNGLFTMGEYSGIINSKDVRFRSDGGRDEKAQWKTPGAG